MSPMEFIDLGSNMTALIHAVVQTNLRTMLEFSRVEDSQALADLQRRFAREYLAALQHGIMTLLSALRPDCPGARRRIASPVRGCRCRNGTPARDAAASAG
jgi:hypothetical protein